MRNTFSDIERTKKKLKPQYCYIRKGFLTELTKFPRILQLIRLNDTDQWL